MAYNLYVIYLGKGVGFEVLGMYQTWWNLPDACTEIHMYWRCICTECTEIRRLKIIISIKGDTNWSNPGDYFLSHHLCTYSLWSLKRRWATDHITFLYGLEGQRKVTALFNNMQTLKFKSQSTNAFFAAVNHMFSGLRLLRSTASLSELCTAIWLLCTRQ